MENTELTYGQKLVGLTFNPSGDLKVIEVKQKCAELIDLLYNNFYSKDSIAMSFIEDAIKNIILAQMLSVKAITWKD